MKNNDKSRLQQIESPAMADEGVSAGRMPNWVRGLIAFSALYLFISSVSMIGAGLKIIGKIPANQEYINSLFQAVSDPITGLFVGVLITSLVQSSSFTTSMIVGLVATGQIQLQWAIPVIMGANIGTSVTNTLVSLANVRRRYEFQRSLGGAIVHDFFNVLSVLLFLPLEYAFKIISGPTQAISNALGNTQFFSSNPAKEYGFIKKFFKAPAELFDWLTTDVFNFSATVAGIIVASLALVILFTALWLLVKTLRGLMQDRMSGLFSRTLFRNAPIAFAVGIITTVAVQSSSVTTSLVIPLIGAGILKLRQIYPYMLGANIGTTMTAMLAALGMGSAAGMACALGHLIFNLYGTVVFWPLQVIPISLAKGFAKLASRRRLVAAGYIIFVFFVIPIAVIYLSNNPDVISNLFNKITGN